MGCAASLPAAPADKGPLDANSASGGAEKGALRSPSTQDISHQESLRSTKASTNSGVDFSHQSTQSTQRSTQASTRSSGLAMGHMQSILSSMGGDEEDKLTAENFNEETGAPDMGNGPLRTNLRHPEQWFEDTSPDPQDFPRLARVFTRRRGRPQACTADDTELQIQAFKSRQKFQSEGSSPGSTTRRFSTPVLAEPRFDEPSSLQTEAEMWRLWSAKDLPLCVPPSVGNDQDGSKTEVDCLGGEYDSLMSTCLPQADHEATLEDEESLPFDEKSTKTPRTSQLHVPPAEGSPAPSASLLVEAMRSALREALVAADEGLQTAAGEAPVMSANERPNREDVLVLLDWDDTILPTTWLASRPWFRNWIHYKACLSDGELMSVEDREALDEVDQMACEFLREINGLGHPVCVTLAQRPWVQQSMKAFMPRLAVLWEVGQLVPEIFRTFIAGIHRAGDEPEVHSKAKGHGASPSPLLSNT